MSIRLEKGKTRRKDSKKPSFRLADQGRGCPARSYGRTQAQLDRAWVIRGGTQQALRGQDRTWSSGWVRNIHRADLIGGKTHLEGRERRLGKSQGSNTQKELGIKGNARVNRNPSRFGTTIQDGLRITGQALGRGPQHSQRENAADKIHPTTNQTKRQSREAAHRTKVEDNSAMLVSCVRIGKKEPMKNRRGKIMQRPNRTRREKRGGLKMTTTMTQTDGS